MLKEHFWASSFQNFPGGMPLNPPRDSRLAPSALETCLVLFWSLATALSLWAFVEIISKWEWQVSWFEELHPKPFPYAREINFEAFKIDLKWIPFLVHYRQNLAFGSIKFGVCYCGCTMLIIRKLKPPTEVCYSFKMNRISTWPVEVEIWDLSHWYLTCR